MPALAPVDQSKRILGLRLGALLVLPLIVLARPVLDGSLAGIAMEQAGILLVVAGVLGRFWSILYIGGRKNAQVVMDGPYSMCRHPLYLFSTVAMTGFGLMTQSVVLALLVGGMTFAILSLTASREEAYLRSSFGSAYDDYARRVPRILPDPRLFRSPPEVTFSVRTLRTNFFDALVFLGLLPLSELLAALRDAGVLPGIVLY